MYLTKDDLILLTDDVVLAIKKISRMVELLKPVMKGMPHIDDDEAYLFLEDRLQNLPKTQLKVLMNELNEFLYSKEEDYD